ncbi:hypothetical protein M9Y10_016386 [Tritrichomonas musculus]|uniref:J domain-containing protein n=1 Tax=Tritrichomonas musculus TaxID=1915356 RepID=A0ABR2HXN8_9EUKA
MLYLPILLIFSKCADPIEQITQMIEEKRYRQGYDTASMYITKFGMLDADPKLFFLRGQCAYYISKFEETINDMSRYITSGSATEEEKKRSYRARGMARMRLGDFDDAKNDADLSGDSSLKKRISECTTLLQQAQQQEANERWTSAIGTYEQLVKIAISGVNLLISASKCALKLGDRDKFIDLSHKAIQISPKSPSLLEMRGKFFFCDAEFDMAIKHFKICRQYASDSSSCTILLKAASSFNDHYKKALNSTSKKDYQTAKPFIESCENISKKRCQEGANIFSKVTALKVKGLVAEGKNSEALSYLTKLLKESPNATDLLLERADLYLEENDLDNAMRDYQQARKVESHNKRAIDGIEKVSKIQEKEKNVDFYEVLGLKRGASVSQVKDAYRKMARIWHPDRYSDPVKKREAERKMKNINRAYDVLTDPEKKQLYDMGQDPENAGMNQGQSGGFPGGFNPFEQFFHGGHFHGGQNIRFEFR